MQTIQRVSISSGKDLISVRGCSLINMPAKLGVCDIDHDPLRGCTFIVFTNPPRLERIDKLIRHWCGPCSPLKRRHKRRFRLAMESLRRVHQTFAVEHPEFMDEDQMAFQHSVVEMLQESICRELDADVLRELGETSRCLN